MPTDLSPIAQIKEHYELAKASIKDAKTELNQIIYKSVRDSLRKSSEEYTKGLDLLWDLSNRSIVKHAAALREQLRAKGKDLPVDFMIRKHWAPQLSTVYQTIERFRNDFVYSQLRANFPPELYLWLYDLFEASDVPPQQIVFQESLEFSNRTLEQMIHRPLEPLEEIAKRPFISGTVTVAEPYNQDIKIGDNRVILYVSGEGKNPTLWPVLIHEAFHIIYDISRWGKEFQQFCTSNNIDLTLHANFTTNLNWLEEIMMDIVSAYYFGPMFAYSLVKYFDRMPYTPSVVYPPMRYRLEVVHAHLKSLTPKSNSDIESESLREFFQIIQRRVELEEKLDAATNNNLNSLYKATSNWIAKKGIMSFSDRIDRYVASSDELNPVLSYKEVADSVFIDLVPPAIHPNIMLNVVLSSIEKYDRERHLPVLLNSIRAWKIKEVWNKHRSISL